MSPWSRPLAISYGHTMPSLLDATSPWRGRWPNMVIAGHLLAQIKHCSDCDGASEVWIQTESIQSPATEFVTIHPVSEGIVSILPGTCTFSILVKLRLMNRTPKSTDPLYRPIGMLGICTYIINYHHMSAPGEHDDSHILLLFGRHWCMYVAHHWYIEWQWLIMVDSGC